VQRMPEGGGGPGAYRRVQAETAAPADLVLMLYDGLLRNLARGERAIGEGRHGEANNALIRSQEIVLELIASLDHEADGEGGALSLRLASVYEYCYRRLVEANLRKQAAPAREVATLVGRVRDAWAQSTIGAGALGAGRPPLAASA
jgi:flagellar protein FliS